MAPVFWWRRSGPGVELGFTSREGGVSAGPYAGLNLGGRVGDDPAAVATNRARLAGSLGIDRDRLLFMAQCHGADVLVVDGPYAGSEPSADAIVTTAPGLALAVLVADCTPILLWDRDAQAIAAVHCGRPGLVGGVLPAALTALRDLGAREVHAVVGPSVCPRCYEVPAPMRAAVAADAPASWSVSRTGTPALDVAAGAVEQLVAEGVVLDEWVAGCTRESPDLYSYRGEGTTGRFAGVVVRHP